jgi:hypothetical protein
LREDVSNKPFLWTILQRSLCFDDFSGKKLNARAASGFKGSIGIGSFSYGPRTAFLHQVRI